MIEIYRQKIKASNEAVKMKLGEVYDRKTNEAEALSNGLNQYLLENKDSLKEFLMEAGDKASVDIGARGALNPTAEPALNITKKRDWNGTTTVVLTVDAPNSHQQAEDLCIRIHHHVTGLYRSEDGHYSHYFKPTENGIEAWPYPNGYCSDRVFQKDLMDINFTPPIEKVIKNLEHQVKKIARKF